MNKIFLGKIIKACTFFLVLSSVAHGMKNEPKKEFELVEAFEEKAGICSLCYMQPGYLILGLFDGSIKVLDMFHNFGCLKIFKEHNSSINFLCCCGNLLFSCSNDGLINLWNFDSKKSDEWTHMKIYEGKGDCVDFVHCTKEGFLFFNEKTLKFLNIFSKKQDVRQLVWGNTGKEYGKISCSNNYMAASLCRDTTIDVLDVSDKNQVGWKIIKTLQNDKRVESILCLGDKYIVTGSEDGTLKVFDVVANFSCVATWHGHDGVVTSIDGTDGYIATGSDDGTIKLWNIKNKFTLITVLKGFKKHICTVCCKNKYIIAGWWAELVRIWKESEIK